MKKISFAIILWSFIDNLLVGNESFVFMDEYLAVTEDRKFLLNN